MAQPSTNTEPNFRLLQIQFTGPEWTHERTADLLANDGMPVKPISKTSDGYVYTFNSDRKPNTWTLGARHPLDGVMYILEYHNSVSADDI